MNTQVSELNNPTRIQRLADPLISILSGMAAFVVYLATLSPSLSYLSPDGSELATIPYILGLAHSPGYPLYTWLGWLFSQVPINDVAYRVNLMSAFLGAGAVSLLYLVIVRLIPEGVAWNEGPSPYDAIIRRAAGVTASLLFAFSPTFWSQAIIAEVYVPNTFFIVLTVFMLLRWQQSQKRLDFFLFALLFGLSLGMHLSDLGFALALAVFILLVNWKVLKDGRWWLVALGGFFLGAAQFLWLPLRAGTLNDRLMLASNPTTLEGFYRYTLGAFTNFRFAFAPADLPGRLMLYLQLLSQELGWLGLVLGILGLFALLFRRTKHFYLLVGMYLVNIWFFIQYSAFDIEVFFIPAHLLWAVFMAFGLRELLALGEFLFHPAVTSGLFQSSQNALMKSKDEQATVENHSPGPRPCVYRKVLSPIIMLVAVGVGFIPAVHNWGSNDRSQDVAINDFYANVWEILPQNSALITQGGVFGYDAFYWRQVYGIRPDVLLPSLPTPSPSRMDLAGRDLYATQNALRGGGPGQLPPDLLDSTQWSVPVLLGETPEEGAMSRGQLVLYHLQSAPPVLVTTNPQPQVTLNVNYGVAALVGADVNATTVESGGRIALTLYWCLGNMPASQPIVSLSLAGQPLVQYTFGLGLLERYASQVSTFKPGDIIMEHYQLVIPSNVQAGQAALKVTLGSMNADAAQTEIVTLTITNEIRTVDGWLQIAGNSY